MNQEIQRQIIPWLKRKEIGFFRALWETIKQILFKPSEFFSNLEIISYSESLLFYFIVSTIAYEVSLMWNLLWSKKPEAIQVPMFFYILIIPIFVVIVLYTGSGIIHLFALLFRGKGGFKGTFNVLAYTSATNIFYIIPFIGGVIGGIWAIIVGVIGFKIIHKFGTVRAVFVYLGTPLLALIILLTMIAIPNLSISRLQANEATTEATLKTISTAIETYRAANGRLPFNEYELRYSEPPYLNRCYHNETISGYKYSLNFTETGYEIIATPSICGTTGRKNFKIVTGGFLSKEDCK